MASEQQQTFFRNLTEQREFPQGTDLDSLRRDFANLDGSNASKWIERALELPEKGNVPPPF